MDAPDRWFIVILTFAKRFCIIKCTPDNCCNLQPNILLLFIHTKNGRKKKFMLPNAVKLKFRHYGLVLCNQTSSFIPFPHF